MSITKSKCYCVTALLRYRVIASIGLGIKALLIHYR